MPAARYIGQRTFELFSADPLPPGPGEVRIDVAYAGICGTDVHIYHGVMDARVKPPQVIGHEMSGVIAEVGPGVTGLQPGEAVVVRPLDNRAETPADRGLSHICRSLKFLGIDSPGAFQSSWTVPAFTVHRAPEGADLRLAALTEPLAVACHDVRLAEVQHGECAVVLGGGPIGILVAMVAREAGADVLLSEVNPARLEFARNLGFTAVPPADLPSLCEDRTHGAGADLVFEVSGAAAATASMTDLLALRGRILLVAIHPRPVEINLFHFFWKELRMIGARVYEPEDYERALALIASGTLPLESMITRIEPLTRINEAFQDLDAHPAGMKTLLAIQPPQNV